MTNDSNDLSRDETIGGVPTLPRGEPPIVVAGRYRTMRLIARGGMASVFLAEQLALHRAVALKILNPPPPGEAGEGESFEKRFKLEAETLATLVHPNIVTVYDYGQDGGRFFLAMEYIDGPRFTDLLVRGALPVDRTIQLLLPVCNALRYAHKRGVVHRDLKPSNLLISRDEEGQEQVKVVDFGLVKVGELEQSLTREGVVMGSPHCMAPEQVQGGAIDHRADIYALGILLYRCLTGTYPFHGSNATATMMLHLTADVPWFSAVAPDLDLPPQLERIVRKCLMRRPEDRYADVVSLAADLSRCVGLAPQADTQSQSLSLDEPSGAEPTQMVALPLPPVVEEPPAPAPRRWSPAYGVVLAVLVIAALAAVWASRGGDVDLRAGSAAVEGGQADGAPVEPAGSLAAPEGTAAAANDGAADAADALATPPTPPTASPTVPSTTPEGTTSPAGTASGGPAAAGDPPPADASPKKVTVTKPRADKPPKKDAPPPPPGYMGLPSDLK